MNPLTNGKIKYSIAFEMNYYKTHMLHKHYPHTLAKQNKTLLTVDKTLLISLKVYRLSRNTKESIKITLTFTRNKLYMYFKFLVKFLFSTA